MGWTAWGSNPSRGKIFHTSSDLFWGPPILPYEYWASFLGVKWLGHGNDFPPPSSKVEWPCYRPGVDQRVGRGIALLFHDRGTRRGWVVSSTPWPHFTPGKDPVPILQEAGWPSGMVWTDGKSRPLRDSIPDCPVRSQSLYWLSYPAHPPSSTKVKERVDLYHYSPRVPPWPVVGWNLHFLPTTNFQPNQFQSFNYNWDG